MPLTNRANRILSWFILCCGIMLAGLTPCLAIPTNDTDRGDVIQVIGDSGRIDWTDGDVRAVGIGFAPATASGAQALVLAREAAIAIAERNLTKIVYGVAVTSETTVKNLTLESDVIKTRVDGFIRGTQIVRERQLPDNAYEITLSMKVYGKSESMAASINLAEQVQSRVQAGTVTAGTPVTAAGGITGLIVDCRGMGLAPCFYPRVINQQGQDLWSVASLSRDDIMQKGMVGYYPSVEEAKADHRVGDNPLVIKPVRLATGKSFKTDVVLSPADADQILAENSQSHFLDKLCVAFLTEAKVK